MLSRRYLVDLVTHHVGMQFAYLKFSTLVNSRMDCAETTNWFSALSATLREKVSIQAQTAVKALYHWLGGRVGVPSSTLGHTE